MPEKIDFSKRNFLKYCGAAGLMLLTGDLSIGEKIITEIDKKEVLYKWEEYKSKFPPHEIHPI